MFFLLMIITIIFGIISFLVSGQLKRKFKEFSKVPTSSGLSGAEIAQKMLRDSNIYDVEITQVQGQLTDHYNPGNKTINLSQAVYSGRNVAAAAVAAHETGHAVQHATAYSFLQFRSAMVPVVNFASNIMQWVFMLFMFGAISSFMQWETALWIVVALQAALTLFSIVTLPVEFDASNRALVWLEAARITQGTEHQQAKSALTWAASTYVVAALASIANLLVWVLAAMGND